MTCTRAGCIALVVVSAFLAAEARAAPPPIRDGENVRVDDGQLVVGSAPFHFVGANVSVMHGPRERASYEAILDAAAADGLSVVRVWAFGEANLGAPAWWDDYAFRRGPDRWLATSFEHLDRVLAAARARGLRVILVLGNRWRDYGGVPTYLGWAHATAPEGRQLETFLACPSCVEQYREHVRRIVGRTSSVTGRPYAEDPTILAYEPLNEGGAVTSDSEEALVDFVRETARLVHSLDPSHLFSAGDIGYTGLRERRQWLRVQSLPEVGFCDAHFYPEGDPRVPTSAEAAQVVDDVAQLAAYVARKPLVFGEFGYLGPEAGAGGPPRARSIDAFLDAAFRDGVAGALLWYYEPWVGEERPHAVEVGAPPEVEHRADGVRRVLSRWAARIAETPPVERNPRLGEAVGDAPLFSRLATMTGPTRDGPPSRWRSGGRAWTLTLDPLAFRVARFERLGIWDGTPVRHFWGSGRGTIEYGFPVPAGATAPPSRLVIRARISSELPGAGQGAAASEVSTVDVLVDDVPLARVTAPVDDGLGHPVEIVVDDAALLARALGRPGRHTLVFVAHESPGAGGLDLYASAGADGTLDATPGTELPAGVEIEWTPPSVAE